MGAKEFFIEAVNGILEAMDEAKAARGGLTIVEALTNTGNARKDFEAFAIKAAFEYLGIEIDDAGDISEASITAAINKAFLDGSGLVLTNVFDGDAIQRDIERFALEQVNGAAGGELAFSSFNGDSMREVARSYVHGKVGAQLADFGGDLIDGAGANQAILDIVAAYEKRQNQPLDESDKAVKNRARQERYRASHKRHWEAR